MGIMYLWSGSTRGGRGAREVLEEGEAGAVVCRASEYWGGCSDGSSGEDGGEGSSVRRSGIVGAQGFWSPSKPALDEFDAISTVHRD